ncbi:probable rRNA maturation factor [Methylobacillus rhizosphaerae]|uniref:Endoribonuclease YbeY n=1 Tax=Methylobacillus rhizosphaerae TaxID=551994 RepID=A0A239ACH1_9PROT|nr:rRNA maturation RNase YbeY [Methylobacillus rhizosphaerae]SNR93041.1 probable rRNA maturation factor [Methylobacillus rhizosphaerae]
MPKLAMTVQYASESSHIPTEKQFRKWARAALRVDTEVTLRIVDAEEGLMLNRDYRGKDYATNVLTFPLTEEPWLIGDIILCAPVVEKEALEQGISLEAHYAHLTVHGILHMHGYDHEEEAQAELMESIESTTMIQLGYADPYLSEKQRP